MIGGPQHWSVIGSIFFILSFLFESIPAICYGRRKCYLSQSSLGQMWDMIIYDLNVNFVWNENYSINFFSYKPVGFNLINIWKSFSKLHSSDSKFDVRKIKSCVLLIFPKNCIVYLFVTFV